ncbi:MAG: MaoC family dehydratase N-terminal domain-containing protein [Deltaproteobacteria bacterium]|nr:MaoC family dehydratase N-terminal domain-containing protein [Deltaproteobacteria bacterium]
MNSNKVFFDLSEVRKLIGKEREISEADAYLARCPVDASELRRYALSLEDCNPLFYEEKYAKNTHWRGIIAPPTFVHTSGGGSALHVTNIPGVDNWPHGNLFAGSEFDFYLPIRVGDTIRPVSKIFDVVEKQGNFVGPMVLITAETSFTNQRNELICKWRQSVMRYSTANAQKKGTYSKEEIGEMYPQGYPESKKGVSTSRGERPLYYEDVNIGSEVPSMVRHLTIPKIVASADVSQRIGSVLPFTLPGPGCYWHYSEGQSWKVRGLPAPMDIGPMRPAQPSQLMTDWIGDMGWLSSLSLQVRRPIYAGDTTTWQGKVIKKHVEDGRHCVECEIWGENQRGQISSKGSAAVILPSKEEDWTGIPYDR